MTDDEIAPRARKRQWGAERRSEPMSIVHARPSVAKIAWGRIAIVLTVVFWLIYVVTTIIREFIEAPGGFRFTMEAIGYLIVVTFLTFSASMYLLARQGALYRFRDHRRVPRAEIDRHFRHHAGGITVLVPSYAEEPGVVRGTLWSAALQEYADLRVVLLVDDPVVPKTDEDRVRLEATLALPGQIEDALRGPSARFAGAREAFERGIRDGGQVTASQLAGLADDYESAAVWLETMADEEPVVDHVDEFFVDQVLMGLASELRLSLLALRAAIDQQALPSADRMLELHLRLERIFSVKASSFQRKRYASLSHEANKAMNLNAYIGLMGRGWRTEESAAGTLLRRVEDLSQADFFVPDTTYLLTLDADSLLLRDYCVRLVYFLEEPGNERVAVTQTPYSSFRGAPTRIERIAGATTDLQHILHQGMSYYGATFWVGANAVIRKRAIEDIVEIETVGGFEIATYIQDRTVIEDTESSIDLGAHGWTLINYPERLSYSATPPDFGSLVVQRRRWANGGLLIMPKLWKQARDRRFRRERILVREMWLRTNYMASIAWASFGLLFLLAYPYDSRLLSPVVFLAALPYFIAMGSDLRYCGHRFSDIFRIYGFNLVLLPVNLAGVLKSMQQALTGEKIPFVRTPKVKDRTAAPAIYVITPYLIVAFSLLTLWRDVLAQNWGNAAFAAFNAVLAFYAIRAYIGIRNSFVDIWLGMLNWLYVPDRKQAKASDAAGAPGAGAAAAGVAGAAAGSAGPAGEAPPAAPKPVDWEGILYHGDRRLNRDLRRDNDRRRRAGSRAGS
ncbi:Glycosyl transferase family group 2 [Agromyces sp. CF514]|uniref:glycosyltransferase family 2 protein n=1 Tax=Agromyces sp. CF514 TaxID=1881031 RepID=UPI0008F44816|nr:glycosyltransferase family 2 protein [Agromyces sp. CF514]SFR72042.1 Glycosyl transferase family group 2 [Agromyces sp. CF514]